MVAKQNDLDCIKTKRCQKCYFEVCYSQRNMITVSLLPFLCTCIKAEMCTVFLSKLIFKPLSRTQPKYVWFRLKLDRSVQSDSNHNHQKGPKKVQSFRAFISKKLSAMISSARGPANDAPKSLLNVHFYTNSLVQI